MALTVDDFAQDLYRQLVHGGDLGDCSIRGGQRQVRRGVEAEGACYVAAGKSPRRLFPAICAHGVTWFRRDEI